MSRHIFVAIFGWQVFYWYMIYLPTISQRYRRSRKFIVLLVLLIFLKLFWNISNRSYFFALNFPVLANSEFQANPQSCYSLKSALCFRKLLKNQFRSCINYSKLGTMCPSLFHCFFSLWNNKHFLIISPVFHPFPLPPSYTSFPLCSRASTRLSTPTESFLEYLQSAVSCIQLPARVLTHLILHGNFSKMLSGLMSLTWGLFFSVLQALGFIKISNLILNWQEFFPRKQCLVKDMQVKRKLQHFDCLLKSRIYNCFWSPLDFFYSGIVQNFCYC